MSSKTAVAAAPAMTVIPAIAKAPSVAIIPAEGLTAFVARMPGIVAIMCDCASMLAGECAGGSLEWGQQSEQEQEGYATGACYSRG